MNKKNKVFIAITLLICCALTVFAQEDSTVTTEQASNVGASLDAATTDASQRIMLARSSPDYRVTPGDVYTLAYAVGANSVSYTIAVDTTYRIRVSNLGIVNGAGKTFAQLKNEVETIVANNYPLSGVQLVLTQPAVFRVFVNGEVYRAGEASAWGLSRLSSLVTGNLTSFASIRDISVRSSNGQVRVYDLFRARRFGEMNHDPYLRPGDVVTFNRLKRSVTVSGAVERPGTYQLLDGENLNELIGFYGNGFRPLADKTRATLTRYIGSTEVSGYRILLTEEELTGNYILQNMDVIRIPDITDSRPAFAVSRMERTITVSGAVRRPGTYELLPHETLKDLIEVYADGFSPVADKTRATLTRYVGTTETSGVLTFLSEEELTTGEYILQHMDVIAIPDITDSRPVFSINRMERTITISGAVRRAGTYELLPHENLKDLIEVYANGLIPTADTTRARLTRYVGTTETSGVLTFLTEEELVTGDYVLQHMDSVVIPDITDTRPVFTVNRMERTITISGAVRREGTYELLPHENLKDLIEIYADGLTPLADTTRARLTRYVGSTEASGVLTFLTEEELTTGDYILQHMDVITIPNITDLRPVFTLNRMERTITISGEVRRPGTYELMPHENLKELIEIYADGFAPLADPTRVELVRRIGSEDISGNRIFLTEEDLASDFMLIHFDSIYVPSTTQLRPVMFVEGAVIDRVRALDTIAEEDREHLAASNRLIVRFDTGDTYAALVRRNFHWFTSVSDTQNAYIVRDDERIHIDLNLALYDASYRDEFLVQNHDVLIIPFRQYFVTVAGAVYSPGRYPYIPDRSWDYYVALAGGFVPGRNFADSVSITDLSGKRLRKRDAITPETIISANTNHLLFFFNQYAPVITTVASIATTLISIFIMSQ